MSLLIPPINLKGTFKLKEPLKSIINETSIYTVDKVVSISSLLEDIIDVETLIFTDQGLTTDDYIYCLKNNIPIVTLKSEGAALFDIPGNYFSYVPQITGKMFINKAIMINLGYIPTDLDIGYIVTEVNDYIVSRTGIEASTTIEEISGDLVLSYAESDVFDASRKALITIDNTCRGLLNKAYATVDTYKIKVKTLVEKLNL